MLEQLHDTINREGWEIEVSQEKIQIPANAKMMDTFGILARLVRQASEYSRRILDVDVYQHAKRECSPSTFPEISKNQVEFDLILPDTNPVFWGGGKQ